ncbi:MAG: TerC family protein [Proteobacteria bacterium]|nr:TerC family protein [Pseudomonadota bacterium]
MEFLFSYELIFILITLTFLEIILGIDNIIFIAITVHGLPTKQRRNARYLGISLALIMRVLMLMTLSWIMSLTTTLFTLFDKGFSVNNLLFIVGGMFLIVKSAAEIYGDVASGVRGEVKDDHPHHNKVDVKKTFFSSVMQIAAVDFIFSFDSMITAIGITTNITIIVIAVVISMIVMLVSSDYISKVLHKYPSLKIMALAFIFMIGVILLCDGLHLHISKTYLYFSLFFATTIECLNIAARHNR